MLPDKLLPRSVHPGVNLVYANCALLPEDQQESCTESYSPLSVQARESETTMAVRLKAVDKPCYSTFGVDGTGILLPEAVAA